MADAILFRDIFDKKRSLDQLIDESRADSDFYVFLSVSAVITTFGLISGNGVAVIGGMLVAPVLFPILSLSMAIVTSSKRALKRAFGVLLRAIASVFAISFFVSLPFRNTELNSEILLRTDPSWIAFLIAIAAGVAAAWGWVRQQSVSSSLAGIAVSVSLIPPLAVFGFGLASQNTQIVGGSISLFLLNLVGILISGIIVFNLFGFAGLKREEEKKITEEAVEDLIKSEAQGDKKYIKRMALDEEVDKVAEENKEKTKDADNAKET